MPKMDGVEATAVIRQKLPGTKVLMLTTYGTSADIRRALAAGAAGAVTKTLLNEELTAAIRDVAEGKTVLTSDVQQSLNEAQNQPEFTQRQMEILESVTRGLTNQDIATQFGITVSGVKQHLNAIFAKLGVSNRSEAIGIVLRRSLLKL